MNIDLYHNIRWSRYKAGVFSALYEQTKDSSCHVNFFQIADTNGHRAALSGVDMSYHRYPHELLFAGSYSAIPKRALIRKLFSKVFRSNAELVLIPGYERPEYWGMLLAALLSGKKRAVFCDSTLKDKPQSWIRGIFKRLFFLGCNGVFCYGNRAREFLLHYGVDRHRIFQRYQAAALPLQYSAEAARVARRRLSPPADAPRFLYVGRLSPEKSLDVLLRAFKAVLADIPRARLVLVGGGKQADEMKSFAASLELADAVEFAGSMDQDALAEQYSMATCLVLPSRTEPWGLVVNEALHYACPVVVSDHCGCVPELVQEGVTGFSFKTDDVSDLAAQLLRVTTTFGDSLEIGEHCLRVISRYTPDVAAGQLIQGCFAILARERAQA